MTSNFFVYVDRKILPSYRSFGASYQSCEMGGQLLTMLAIGFLLMASGEELYAVSLKGQLTVESPSAYSNRFGEATGTVKHPVSSVTGAFIAKQESRDSTKWLEGEDFERKLQDIQTVQWQRASLGQIISEAQRSYQLRIWMDRRVDTSQIVNLKMESLSIGQSLATLAKTCRSEVVFMSPIVMIVPEGTAAQFLALRANMSFQVSALPNQTQRQLFARTVVKWSQFEQPNNLLRQWIAPVSESLAALDSLPHDAWAEGDLPELTLADRLLLLSFGFDKRFQLTHDSEGLNLRLVDITPDSELVCWIESKDWIQALQAQQTSFAQQFPDVQWTTTRGKRLLSGRLHEVAAVLQSALKPVAADIGSQNLADQRFTLTVTRQVAGNILQTIAQQTKTTMVLDSGAKEALQKRMDLNARDLTIEQLLQKVADATQTDIQLQGTRIIVSGRQ